ncbi:MAG TPA: cytochrome c, partial [Vicinamibacteria bacterium]|nr:cytochrome c [Vicinamibacteria bacterium]
LLFAAVLTLAAAGGAAAGRTNPNRGKSLYKATCKACHVKGGEAKALSPLTKTQAQWTRAFKPGTVSGCVKKVAAKTGRTLTPDDLADMEAYLVAHAADSDQPETCGQ